MGTTFPSGKVAVAGPAVKLTDCAVAAPVPRRRTAAPHSAVLIIALRELICVSVLLLLGFIDYEFPGINQHHHQHSARKYVVGGDLALIVRVPHEGKAALAGRIGLRSGRRNESIGADRASGGIIAQVGTAAEPRAVGQNEGIR